MTKYSTEIHPNWYQPINEMRTLILGTFPPHELKRNFQFYYPNKNNHFWNILAKLDNNYHLKYFDDSRITVKERITLMNNLRIGVQNVAKVIKRKNKSSADKDITLVEPQDILSIIQKHHKTLKTILLTGYSGKSSTYGMFMSYLKNHTPKDTLLCPTKPRLIKAGTEFTIYYKNSPIICIIGNSTSPAARRAGITFEKLYFQFAKAINY